jgi:integrase
MQQAIGLLTGGAEGAGDAQDPSRTIASERALNGAIVAAHISQSFEEYLEIFDHFYAEDIEGTTDTMKEPVHGKAAVRTRLAGFLIPLHVFAEIGGVSVSIQSRPIRGDRADETHSAWTLRLRGVTGAACTVKWCSRRRWRLGRVVSELLYLQTMVRKSELQDATWDEVDFENAVWTIPKERMKRSKAHNVYLSRQVLDIMIALKTCAGNSKYLLPSRYDADAPMSRATFNRVTYAVVEQAKKDGLPLEPFTVHDLRRTGSTLLNELGFNSDWIEKCLAHEDGLSSRGVYNKAEYEVQRRHMMQEWSDIIDAWVAGKKRVPVLIPPSMPLFELDPAFEQGVIAVA